MFLSQLKSLLQKKIKVKITRAIPTGASTMPVKEMIDIPSLVALKTIQTLSM